MGLWKRVVGVPSVEEVVEDLVHTLEYPYCDRLDCWCHTDVAYHAQVVGASSSDGGVFGSLLEQDVDDDLFERAMAMLTGG